MPDKGYQPLQGLMSPTKKNDHRRSWHNAMLPFNYLSRQYMMSVTHWQWHSGLQYLPIQKLNYKKYSWQFTWLAMYSSVRKKNRVDIPVKRSGSSTSPALTLNRLHLLNMTKCGWIDGLTCLQLNLTFKFICTSMQLRLDSTAVKLAFVNGWWQKVVYTNVTRGKSGTNAYGSWKYRRSAGRAMTARTRISLYLSLWLQTWRPCKLIMANKELCYKWNNLQQLCMCWESLIAIICLERYDWLEIQANRGA